MKDRLLEKLGILNYCIFGDDYEQEMLDEIRDDIETLEELKKHVLYVDENGKVCFKEIDDKFREEAIRDWLLK